MHKGMTGLYGLCMAGGLLGLASSPRASARVGVIDKELLGARLLQSYKTVLSLYGQPTHIYRADEVVSFDFATDANGKETGGIKGINTGAQSGGGPGGGPMGGPMGGAPNSGGGGPMNAPPPPPRSKGPSASGGAPSSGGGPLGGAQSTSDKPETFGESGGFIWVYFYPREELAYRFAFNGDGRLETIAERGRWKGKPSPRGIHLGDPVRNVYAAYGWPDTVDQQVNTLVLNYNLKHHCQFSTLNGKVVGISVFLREDQMLRLINPGSGGPGGGAPSSGGPGGGRPGPGGAGGSKTD